MSAITILAIYFIVWWMVLFAVLPWGATSAHESGADIAPGHAPSAPLRPMLMRKLLVTTAIAALIVGIGTWLWRFGFLSLDNLSFMPGPAFRE
jgi:predicted secreted protein